MAFALYILVLFALAAGFTNDNKVRTSANQETKAFELEYGEIGPWIFLCMYSFSMFSQLIFLLFVILNEDTNNIKCILFTVH
jgi:hypothetical protein